MPAKPLDITGKRQSGALWLCKCDCGVSKAIRGTAMRCGHIKSCGCEKLRGIGGGPRTEKDLTGMRFGHLVVAERHKGIKRKKTYWRCLCDCGNDSIVRGADLLHQNTKSCGCRQMSGLIEQTKKSPREAGKEQAA